MHPVWLPRPRIDAVDVAGQFADKQQVVVNGWSAERAAEDILAFAALGRRAAVVPDEAGIFVDGRLRVEVVADGREVLVRVLRRFGEVDAPQMADAGTI